MLLRGCLWCSPHPVALCHRLHEIPGNNPPSSWAHTQSFANSLAQSPKQVQDLVRGPALPCLMPASVHSTASVPAACPAQGKQVHLSRKKAVGFPRRSRRGCQGLQSTESVSSQPWIPTISPGLLGSLCLRSHNTPNTCCLSGVGCGPRKVCQAQYNVCACVSSHSDS